MDSKLENAVQHPSTLSATTQGQSSQAFTRTGTLKLKIQPSEHASTDNNDDIHLDCAYYRLCQLNEITGPDGTRAWVDVLYFRLIQEHLVDKSKPTNAANITLARVYKVPLWSEKDECLYTIDGFADCLDPETRARIGRTETRFSDLDEEPTLKFLYISQPKLNLDGTLEFNVPKAILEMAACARCLGKDIIRGMLTNGRQWMFLILRLHKEKYDSEAGGVYAQSDVSDILDHASDNLSQKAVAFLNDIMAYWLSHSYEDIGTGDYFGFMGC